MRGVSGRLLMVGWVPPERDCSRKEDLWLSHPLQQAPPVDGSYEPTHSLVSGFLTLEMLPNSVVYLGISYRHKLMRCLSHVVVPPRSDPASPQKWSPRLIVRCWRADVHPIGNNPPDPPKAPASAGTTPKDAGLENAKEQGNSRPSRQSETLKTDPASADKPSDDMKKVLSFHPTGKLVHTPALAYIGKLNFDTGFSSTRCDCRSTPVHMVQIRDGRERMGSADVGKMEGEHEQSLDFRGSALAEMAFPILTSIKAALFTAIVTAFVLDAMSDLDEDNATKLLRVLVEQSITNSSVEIPSPDPPSSALTVSGLWFLSIMFSLAATTWAILCLEWCAFLPDGVPAEDYEEMAEKRQRRFEAMDHWKMRLVVAAIPLFLHVSLFLFLAGLWLRLRDMNKQLGLMVGASSLVIVSSYVVVTLLPIFTNAPFPTSASELVKPVVDWIRRIAELLRFVHPPPVFSWIANVIPVGSSLWSLLSSDPLRTQDLIPLLKSARPTVGRFIGVVWKTIALLPIIPTFGPDQNPFKELNKLKVGRSSQDKGIHQRALFWLLNTPLSKDEVKEILRELGERRYNDGKPLDRAIIRLLVLSLSSILEDNRVSDDEELIFDHCITALSREMDRAFGDGGCDQRILFRNAMIAEKLSPHLPLTVSDEDSLSKHSALIRGEGYWTRAVPALWLCPSTKTIRNVVNRLDSNMQTRTPLRLRDVVRALHAATLSCSNPKKFDPELIPDFGIWSWDGDLSNQGLDKALSEYLQSLFAAFYNTLKRCGDPTTATSLVVDCLKALDDQPSPGTIRLHNALCFFVAVTQRSDPKVFEEGPSVARALLESAESWRKYSGEDDLTGAEVLATRLRAITYGPRSLIPGQNRPLMRLGDLYAGLPPSIKKNQHCIEGFLATNAATLEATLAVDGRFTVLAWQRSQDYLTAQNICTNSLFTCDTSFGFVLLHQNYRLPYLYSLAIALSYAAEGENQGLWKVVDLLVTHGEQEEITVDKALDTNLLVVTVLRFALQNRSETVEQERKERILILLQSIVINGTDWRTRWKSIYLIADILVVLSKMNIQREAEGQIAVLINAARKSFQDVELERAPSDWERKRDGLVLCRLDTKVKDLALTRGQTDEGIYEWSGRESIPYLSLYNPRRTSTESIYRTAYWAVATLR